MTQTQTLKEFVSTRFGGVLCEGAHQANGRACALEALNAYHGRYWTDDPDMARIWDLRPLNDAHWRSNQERTAHLLPLLVAYDGCLDWPLARQQAVVERIVVETVRQFVSELPGLSTITRQLCHKVSDIASARAATVGARNLQSPNINKGIYCAFLATDNVQRADATNAPHSSSYLFAEAARCAAKVVRHSIRERRASSGHSIRERRASSGAILRKACEIWLDAAHPR